MFFSRSPAVSCRQSGFAAEPGPRPPGISIQLLQRHAGFAQELAESDVPADVSQLPHEAVESAAYRLPQVLENQALRDPIELDLAAGGPVGGGIPDLLGEARRGRPEPPPKRLEEHRGPLRRLEKQDCVALRDGHAFVEEAHGEQYVDVAAP